jgi:hypothetical protein
MPALVSSGDARFQLTQWNQFSGFFGSVCGNRDLVVEVIRVRVAMVTKHDPGSPLVVVNAAHQVNACAELAGENETRFLKAFTNWKAFGDQPLGVVDQRLDLFNFEPEIHLLSVSIIKGWLNGTPTKCLTTTDHPSNVFLRLAGKLVTLQVKALQVLRQDYHGNYAQSSISNQYMTIGSLNEQVLHATRDESWFDEFKTELVGVLNRDAQWQWMDQGSFSGVYPVSFRLECFITG